MVDPLVTAIIPSYERPLDTQRAIDSVESQSYSPLELIVVDDGSTPPLAESLELPAERLEAAELIRLDENQGANVARNTGIEAASGDYVAFLDSDDEWKREKTRRQIDALHKTDWEASYTGLEQIDENGNLNDISRPQHSGYLHQHLLMGNVVGTFSSLIIERSVIERIGKPDPELPSWQDWEWYLRLSRDVRFLAIGEPLVRRHNENEQISRSFTPKHEIAYPILRERLLEVAQTQSQERRSLAALDYALGYSALVNGKFPIARKQFLSSIRRNPRNWRSYIYLALSGRQYYLARRLKKILYRRIHQ